MNDARPAEPEIAADASADQSAPAGAGRHRRGRASRPFWLEAGLIVVVAVVVALLVRGFLVQLFYIPSGSMENTLQVGDRVAVNKLAYRFGEISRGDVVVFDGTDTFAPEVARTESSNPLRRALETVGGAVGLGPSDENDFVKRVVGIGGDRVVCCDDDGRLTVNGVALDEPYLYPGNPPSTQEFDVEVPEGRIWVMGDHRSASSDSRSHLGDPGGGTVAEDRVVGRAFAVVWPIGNFSRLDRPDTFGQDFATGAAAPAAGAVLAGAAVLPALRSLRSRKSRRARAAVR